MAKKDASLAPIGNSDKLDVLRSLTSLLDAVSRAQEMARREGWQEEADLLEKWCESLDATIDRVRARVLEDWILDVNALTTQVERDTKAIEAAIKELKKSIKTAENAIKIAGFVDDAIKAVAKFLA